MKEPAAPTKEGYIFAGWYSDSACTKTFDFKNTKITSDTKIYAKFISEDEKFTVSFNSNGGSSVASQTVNAGEKVTKPTDPTKTNFKFAGWYCDSALSEAYDFSTPVLSNITLYAKWTAESGTFTVTFNSNGGSAVPAQTVKAGEKAVKPSNPTKSGCTFSGWYSDSALTTQYNFNSAVTANVTLYAKWTTSGGGGGGGGPSGPTYYTVTFCVNNSPYDTVSNITPGTALGDKMPGIPSYEGRAFEGWNTNTNGSGDSFTKDTPVNNSITVYAQWSNQIILPPKSGGNTAAIDDDADITELVDNAKTQGENTILFDASSFDNADAISISISQMSKINNAIESEGSSINSITLKTKESTVTLDSSIINDLATTGTQTIVISAVPATNPPTITNVFSAVFYDLSILDNNNNPIDLDGRGTITVTVPAGNVTNPSTAVVFFVDSNGNLVSPCDTTYANGEITFTTTHNSYYAIIQQPFDTSAKGEPTTIVGTDGKYEATFTLSEKSPGDAYDKYVVDFILTIDTTDSNGFYLDFDGKTFKQNSSEPTGIKLEKQNYFVKAGTTSLYFSDIYMEGGEAGSSYSFTVDKVWTAGAGGKAVATVSNIKGLDASAGVTLTMIMYADETAKNAGEYFVLSNTVSGTAAKSSFDTSAKGEPTTIVGTDGKYEATFTLSEKSPGDAYDKYVVDFILTIDTTDSNGFYLDFDGKTFKQNSSEPTGIKLEKQNYFVKAGTTSLYFSDIYMEGGEAGSSYSFTVDKVWTAGAGGKAVATVSNIKGLDASAGVTLTMIMYADETAKNAGEYFVLSNTVSGTAAKSPLSTEEP